MSGPRGPRINPILAGILAGAVMIFIVGVMAKINLDFAAPWASTHTVSVMTSDADGISISSDVRVNGRLVGQVTGVTARGSQTEITVHVDGAEWPLPSNTTASIRLATLLGQKYVQLQVDKPNACGPQQNQKCGPLDKPIQDAKPVVDFDQIIDQFDKPTRAHLGGLIQNAGSAVQGTEGTVQQLLPDLRDLSQHSVVPTGELANRDASLNSILVNLATTADQLSASREDLAGLITNFNTVTTKLAQNTDALRGFIVSSDVGAQEAHQLLGNGYGAQLGRDFIATSTAVHDLDNLLTQVLPQSQSVIAPDKNGKSALDSAIALIYEIGDATGQSSHNGYFLREYLQGLDFSGLTGAGSTGAQNPSLPLCIPAGVPLGPLGPILNQLPGGPPPPCPALSAPHAATINPVPQIQIPGLKLPPPPPIQTGPLPIPTPPPGPSGSGAAPTPPICIPPLCGIPASSTGDGSSGQSTQAQYVYDYWWGTPT